MERFAPVSGPAAAIFGGLAVFLVIWWLGEMIARLPRARRSLDDGGPPPNVVDAVGLRVPVEWLMSSPLRPSLEETAAKLDSKLVYAGRPFGGVTGMEYISLLLVSSILGFVVFTALFSLASGSPIAGLAAGMLLGILPSFYFWVLADDRMQNRSEAVSREFPYFLDLVVMTQQAQATLPESLRLYAAAAPSGVMSEEIEQTLKDMNLGAGLIEALRRLEQRINAEEVVRVVRAMIQGEIEGSNRLELLREHARDLRFRRWENAERASEKLKAKIVMPAMLIVTSILLLVLAPAIVEMTAGGLF
jgi:tight adherence protein C